MSMNTTWRDERARRLPVIVLVVVLMGGCAYGGYSFGHHRSGSAAEAATLPVTATHGAPAGTKASEGRPFANDSFRITVTDVKLHCTRLPKRKGGAYRPKNGQFVLVYVTAKNVGKQPAIMSATASQLIDAQGRTYNAGVYLGGADQGLDQYQQPGTSARGWMAFDIPAGVTSVSAVVVQPDENLTTTNLPTRVSLS